MPRPSGLARLLSPRRLEAQTPDYYSKTADLDLGCFYELATGQRGVVQAMGERLGTFDGPPYIRLDRDALTGSSTGENLFINLQHHEAINRALIFAYIYSPTTTFAGTDVVVSMIPSAGPPIDVALDIVDATARSCAVALITHADGDLVLQRETRYSSGYQAEIDAMYGWGLRWTDGTKHF
jgi:tellurite resistance protein TerA